MCINNKMTMRNNNLCWQSSEGTVINMLLGKESTEAIVGNSSTQTWLYTWGCACVCGACKPAWGRCRGECVSSAGLLSSAAATGGIAEPVWLLEGTPLPLVSFLCFSSACSSINDTSATASTWRLSSGSTHCTDICLKHT